MKAVFRQPLWLCVWVLALACIGSGMWVVWLQWHWPWAQLLAHPDTLPLAALVVQSQTLPRMLMAVLAGAALACATVLMQQMLRNPLAADSTLAVSSGAQTALLAATVFVPAATAWGNGPPAFAGGVAALGLVLLLSSRQGLQPLVVVLAGMVLSLYLGAVSGLLTLFYAEEVRGMLLWGSGSLRQESWHDSLQLLWRLAAAAVVAAMLAKPLSIMALSDAQAASLGIPVRQVRLAVLILAAFLSASVVGLVGMMGFVGLAAASVVRQLGVRTVAMRLWAAAVMGGLLLWLTDNALVLLHHYFGVDLPAGAVSAVLGAPLLLWLMASLPTRSIGGGQDNNPTVRLRPALWLRFLPALAGWALVVALTLGHSAEGWWWSMDGDILALRYPRTFTAAAAGVMLACCGVLLQRLTRNPMAGPELLGISSAATVGVMSAVLLWNIPPGGAAFWLVGMAAALAALGLMVWLNRRNGLQPEKVLLTGIAMAAFSDAALRVWLASGDLRVQQLLVWVSGSTYQATPVLGGSMLVLALLLCIVCLPLSRWLGLLGLGGVVAQSAGVPVGWARASLVVLGALLTALATLLVGPMSFVGLLAPHLATLLGARLPRQQLLSAAWLGGSVMVIADWAGRQLAFPYEIPAGLMATLLGGAYFLYMMRRLGQST